MADSGALSAQEFGRLTAAFEPRGLRKALSVIIEGQ